MDTIVTTPFPRFSCLVHEDEKFFGVIIDTHKSSALCLWLLRILLTIALFHMQILEMEKACCDSAAPTEFISVMLRVVLRCNKNFDSRFVSLKFKVLECVVFVCVRVCV